MNRAVINILYSSLSGEIVGGGQHSLLLLLERLDRSRFRPFLVCPTSGEVIERARTMGVETAVIPMPPLRRFSFPSLLALTRLVKTRQIDLIHADTPRQAFYLGLAGALCHRPMIWHIRTSEKQNGLFDRLLFAMARRVVPVSRATAQRFRHLPGQQKIRIVPNGIDVADYARGSASERIRAEFVPGGELLIGSVAQLVPEKGMETFLDAAALVFHRVGTPLVGVRFLIVGRGTDDYVALLKKKAVDLGIADHVIFTGFRRDIPAIMAGLDVFVLATKAAEGLSRAILEAMAGATPVVTTPVGGNPELVVDGETGILVPADNVQALASAMVELIENDKKRKDMGTRGYEKVKAEFDLASSVRSIERIYDELSITCS